MRKKPSTQLVYILIVLNLGMALISAGYFAMEKKRFKHEFVSQLQSITDVKVSQIMDWRKERLSDARYLSKSYEVSRNFTALAADTGNKISRMRLYNDLNAMFLNGKYEAMLAVNSSNKCFLRIPENFRPSDPPIVGKPYIMGKSGEIIMGDMYLNADGEARIDIRISVSDSLSTGTRFAGWIILRINPEKRFFALVNTIPVISKTMVAELVKKEQEKIIVINRKDLPAIGIETLTASERPNVEFLAVSGFRGITEGTDSRGKKVIASVGPVPESDWHLVVKLEKSEAYAGLRKIMLVTSALALLLMTALTTSILLFWSRQRMEMESLEQEQQQLSERYDWLSQYANDVILLFDHELRILQVNDKAVLKYGYSQDELLTMTLDKLRSPATRGELKEKLSEIMSGGGQRFETVHQKKNGSEFPVEESTKFINTNGENCFQSIVRDITERKTIERALIESEERMRMITNSLPQIIWTAKADGSFDYFNSRFEAITGLLPFKGTALVDSVHPGDRQRATEVWSESIREGNPFQIELRLRVRDGSYRWFLGLWKPYHDQQGKIVKWFGSATDIEDLKNTAQELHRRELLLRNAVNNLPSSFTIYDDLGRIEYINDFSLVRSDLTADEAIGKKEEDIFPEEITKNYLPVLADTYRTKEPQVIECLVNYADAPRYVIFHFVPTLDENNNIYKVLGMAYDITERKHTEEKLKEAIEKSREYDRLKSAFLANISHEIRTPLNAIMGFSQMIQKTFHEDEQLNGYVEIIMASAEQLLGIIKQMIEISQLESGGSSVNPVRFSITGMMHEIYQAFCHQEKNKLINGIRFEMELDDRLTENTDLFTDRDKLSHILRNLLSNAFKFTKEGGIISLGCKILEDDLLQFFVRDTGIGIEESKLQVVFSSFRQADESFTRNYGGVGLGLSISRNLVSILGGKIWADSEPGKGSVFYFTLPFSKNQ